MRVDNHARILRQSLTTRKRLVNFLLGSRAHVTSPLFAAPLVVRRTMLLPLHRCAFRVLNRGAQADARPAVRSRVDDRARVTYAAVTPAVRKVSGARQNPATIAV
jgi:hypothetical protein